MLGTPFVGFVTLAVISLVAVLFVHDVIRYRVLDGVDGFMWKWILGWAGAWLGSSVVDNWFHRAAIGHV
jgi:uncharacterized membrane protein YeaQ/YmgE (transglycosylase-associated protein family)